MTPLNIKEQSNSYLIQIEETCNLFDNFGVTVQFFLGCFVFAILILKRYIEVPRRTWKVWFFDTSKQGFGQFAQHVMNLIISYKLGKTSHQCEWYILNIINDLVFGIFLQYLFFLILEWIIKKLNFAYKTGDYGQNTSFKEYLLQLCLYILIVIASKATNTLIILIACDFIEIFGSILLWPFGKQQRIKFIFVMIVYPTIFGIIQFWIVDNFLKKNEKLTNKEKEKDFEEKNYYNYILGQNDKEENENINEKDKDKDKDKEKSTENLKESSKENKDIDINEEKSLLLNENNITQV